MSEETRLPHPAQCRGDPTKLHNTVKDILDCPACSPEYQKELEKRGFVREKNPKKQYII